MRPQAGTDRPFRPAWRWAPFVFGGWWALSRGWLVCGAVATGGPFLLLWYGRAGTAVWSLLAAHVVLGARHYRSRDLDQSLLLEPLALPLLVFAAVALLAGLLELTVVPSGAVS